VFVTGYSLCVLTSAIPQTTFNSETLQQLAGDGTVTIDGALAAVLADRVVHIDSAVVRGHSIDYADESRSRRRVGAADPIIPDRQLERIDTGSGPQSDTARPGMLGDVG
jgi:hypothetical protein